METYRKTNQWTSHSRDMVESFKRYYNNSFLDKQRQEAYNLFLGNYTFVQGEPMLWDLSTDYYLHHADPRAWSVLERKSYVKWFTPEHLDHADTPLSTKPHKSYAGKPLYFFDEYWLEYYRPHFLTSFKKLFPIKMNSTYKYLPFKSTKEDRYDLSPFRVRDRNEHASPEKTPQKIEVTMADPDESIADEEISRNARHILQSRSALLRSLSPQQIGQSTPQYSTLKDSQFHDREATQYSEKPPKEKKTSKDKSAAAQWTLEQFVFNSLNPSVSEKEAHDYQRYTEHPSNIPLVVSNELPPNPSTEFVMYVNSAFVDPTEEDLAGFAHFLAIAEDPLTVADADIAKKRYKAYRQWMKGKSLFKQRVDPSEFIS